MIYPTLEYIRLLLNNFIQNENSSDGSNGNANYVALGDVGLLDDQSKFNNTLVMGLVFLEEEQTLKNSSPYMERNGNLELKNPPVYVNLAVIFCSNFKHDNYSTALRRLSEVIKFFQSKNTFTFSTSPVEGTSPFNLTNEQKNTLELKVEMMNLSLEDINQVWGILRIQPKPFVMYKIRMVRIEADRKLAGGELINEVELSVK